MSKEHQKSPGEHNKIKLAVGVGAAVAATGALGYSYFRSWHRRRSELLNSGMTGQEETYREQLDALSKPLEGVEDTSLLPRVAVQVYEATVNSMDGVTMPENIAASLKISPEVASQALRHLQEHKLVRYRDEHEVAEVGGNVGFLAEEALYWGITEGDSEPLQDAMSELFLNLNDSSYSSGESLDPER